MPKYRVDRAIPGKIAVIVGTALLLIMLVSGCSLHTVTPCRMVYPDYDHTTPSERVVLSHMDYIDGVWYHGSTVQGYSKEEDSNIYLTDKCAQINRPYISE